MLDLYAVCLLATLAISFTYYIAHAPYSAKDRRLTSLRMIRNLLDPPDASVEDLLLARSIPNDRLTRAFELTNTFVSPDPSVHIHFRETAIHMLQSAPKWPKFLNTSIEAVSVSLPDTVVPFDRFIQEVTMRVVLTGLLHATDDMAQLEPDDIHIVSALITELWTLSKKPDHIDGVLLEKLNHHLRRLIPDEQRYPNPLDYVIPSWETLWRVVAAVIRSVHSNTEYRTAFAAFYNKPDTIQYREHQQLQASVEGIILETLRLYPPSKRIARAVRPSSLTQRLCPVPLSYFTDTNATQVYTADIESVHMSETIWGPNASAFDARRVYGNSADPRTILAFGYGPLKCVAKQWAPIATAVIVAAVLDRVNATEYRLIEGCGSGGRNDWNGWTICRVDRSK